jgi:hypothetical protein
MDEYVIIPNNRILHLTLRFSSWSGIRPVETADGRHVIPLRAIEHLENEVLPTLEVQFDIDTLNTARATLESYDREIYDNIVWIEYDLETGERIN